MKAFVAVLAVFGLLAMTEALLIPTVVASSTLGLTVPLIGGSSATLGAILPTATALAGGALLLKSVAVLAASGAGGLRLKRSAEDEEQSETAFAYIAQSEPQACYRRLICDLATGGLPASDNDIILAAFNEEVPATSTKFEYAIAAQVGKALKDVQACELRYSCPLTGQQINKLFN